MALILACISFLIVSATVSGQLEFYCNKTLQAISGVTEGTIVTLMPGTQFYSNDLSCEWTIDAGTRNRVQLVMEQFDLEWSATYATCTGYDNLQVFEGLSTESPVLTALCHARNPYSIISQGQYLYLRFSSNNQNFYNKRGIRIKFHTFNNESCPPGWFQVSSSSPDCLMIGQLGTIADWDTAQDNCNLNRANLASVLSQDELSSILEHGRNISGGLMNAWIGLKHQQGSYKWIDQQKFNFTREVVGKSYNKDCVAQEFKSGNWQALECDTEHSYICKAKKDGSTILYQSSPPSKPPEEENRGTTLYLLVIIVPVVLVCVIAVLFYCCYWRRRNEHRNNKRNKAGTDEVNAVSVALSPPARQNSIPSAPPANDVMLYDPQMVAPPTYEEAQFHSVAPSYY